MELEARDEPLLWNDLLPPLSQSDQILPAAIPSDFSQRHPYGI
jgi:hypothetical protein